MLSCPRLLNNKNRVLQSSSTEKADARTRTADPFITSDDGNIGKALQIALYRVREQP